MRSVSRLPLAARAIDDVEMLPTLFSQFCQQYSGVFKSFHHGWGGKTQTALERIESLLWLTPSRFVKMPSIKDLPQKCVWMPNT